MFATLFIIAAALMLVGGLMFAETNGSQMSLLTETPPQNTEVADVGGKLRVFNETIGLASQASGDIITVGRIPKNARILYIVLNSSVSLGTSTIKIGVSGSTEKYLAARTLTGANTPTIVGQNAGVGVKLTAEESLILTVGVAPLPGAGTLRVQTVYTVD